MRSPGWECYQKIRVVRLRGGVFSSTINKYLLGSLERYPFSASSFSLFLVVLQVSFRRELHRPSRVSFTQPLLKVTRKCARVNLEPVRVQSIRSYRIKETGREETKRKTNQIKYILELERPQNSFFLRRRTWDATLFTFFFFFLPS